MSIHLLIELNNIDKRIWEGILPLYYLKEKENF